MASINLLNRLIRSQVLEESKSSENDERKAESLKQYEIYKDRIHYYVKNYLEGFYSKSTIEEMPILSSVNIARRIVNKEASIYVNAPKRTFVGVSEAQAEILNKVYQDMMIDAVMLKANRSYKLQDDQTHLYIIPSEGMLKARVLLGHQLDVVPSIDDAEKGDAYFINGFDRRSAGIQLVEFEDGQNELIADSDDYQAGLKAIAVWSKLFNFVMDENGNILSSETLNPLGVLPIVDINGGKDGEYWVRSGSSLTEFTVQFNAALSDLQHIVRMQGFGQAWLKGDSSLIPENIKIGPNFILKLPVNPNNPVDTDFGFSNANPDIQGTIQQVELLLSTFLTSRGLDPKLVNGKGEGKSFQSGFDRLLSMIDSFEPSKSDFATFQKAEEAIFKIVRAYINKYGGTSILPEYRAGIIPENSTVSIQFSGPETIVSDKEKLEIIEKKLSLGLMSKAEAVSYDRGITLEEAQELLSFIDESEMEDSKEDELEDEKEDMNGSRDQVKENENQPENQS